MGVIADYWNGPCHIIVHDDSIRPPEEVKKIIQRVSQIIYQEELRKHMQKLEKEKQLSEKPCQRTGMVEESIGNAYCE